MRKSAILLGFALGIFAFSSTASSEEREAPDSLLIKDVTLISPERNAPLKHADVLVVRGRIAQIGARLSASGARRIDGRGRFLIPGLIDSHVHVGAPVGLDADVIAEHPEFLTAYRTQLPRSYLAFGFTTLIDFDFRQKTRQWFDSAPVHPRLYSCGMGLRLAGGYGTTGLPKTPQPDSVPFLLYDPTNKSNWPTNLNPPEFTPEREVERSSAMGAICIKVFYEPGFGGVFHWPVPSPETMTALHDAAAAHQLPLAVHANALEAWHAAMDAHAEILAHGLWQWPGDKTDPKPTGAAGSVIEEAARRGVFVQPTMQTVLGERSIVDAGIIDDPGFALAMPRSVVAYLHSPAAIASWRATKEGFEQKVPNLANVLDVFSERAVATVKLMYADHVHLLFGSDTPAEEGIGNPPGYNGRLEMQRWADAGISPAYILRAATLDNAAAFGLDKDLGSIEVGKRADLLLLGADPLRSVNAYDSIEMIIIGGRAVERSQLAPVN